MEKDLVSVVIPIYNSERFLEKCINSILNQKYKNIEVLLINDGSTDSSGKICDYLAKKDDRIKVFHKDNSGVSDSRNYGIKKSTGKYIAFIDSDDDVNETYIDNLLLNIINNDISVCRFNVIKNKKVVNSEMLYNIKNKVDISQVLNDYSIGGYCWNKLYKKDVIVNNNIKFDSNIKINEDLIFNLKYFKYVKSIGCCNSLLYNYYIRKGSALHGKKHFENFEALEKIIDLLKEYENDKRYYYMQNYILDFYKRTAIDNSFFDEYCFEKVKEYKGLLHNRKSKMFSIKLFIICNLKFVYWINYKIKNVTK